MASSSWKKSATRPRAVRDIRPYSSTSPIIRMSSMAMPLT